MEKEDESESEREKCQVTDRDIKQKAWKHNHLLANEDENLNLTGTWHLLDHQAVKLVIIIWQCTVHRT